jgi:hypothetical protein
MQTQTTHANVRLQFTPRSRRARVVASVGASPGAQHDYDSAMQAEKQGPDDEEGTHALGRDRETGRFKKVIYVFQPIRRADTLAA